MVVEVAHKARRVRIVGFVDAAHDAPVATERAQCVGRGELREARQEPEPHPLRKRIEQQAERIRDLLPLTRRKPRGQESPVRAAEAEGHQLALDTKWIAVGVTVPNTGTSFSAIAVSPAGVVTATRNTSPGKGLAIVDSMSEW